MKKGIEILLLSLCFLNLSCNNTPKKQYKNVNSIPGTPPKADIKRKGKNNFLDSLLIGSDLSIAQIERHTMLDKSNFVPNATFTIDTVYDADLKHTIAIIMYNDKLVCLNYYLFVFDKNDLKNKDFKLVRTGCDAEEGVSSSSLDFSIVNNSLFYTKDIYTERSEGKDDSVIVKRKHYYKINKSGKIVSFK